MWSIANPIPKCQSQQCQASALPGRRHVPAGGTGLLGPRLLVSAGLCWAGSRTLLSTILPCCQHPCSSPSVSQPVPGPPALCLVTHRMPPICYNRLFSCSPAPASSSVLVLGITGDRAATSHASCSSPPRPSTSTTRPEAVGLLPPAQPTRHLMVCPSSWWCWAPSTDPLSPRCWWHLSCPDWGCTRTGAAPLCRGAGVAGWLCRRSLRCSTGSLQPSPPSMLGSLRLPPVTHGTAGPACGRRPCWAAPSCPPVLGWPHHMQQHLPASLAGSSGL